MSIEHLYNLFRLTKLNLQITHKIKLHFLIALDYFT